MPTMVRSNLVFAVGEIYDDLRREINQMLYTQLEERNIEYPKGFDFFGLLEGLIRKSGLNEDLVEEALQDIMVHMFVRTDKKSILDLYDQEKMRSLHPDDDERTRKMRFPRWFNTAVSRRVLNVLERVKRERRERPTDFQPSDDEEGGGWGIDRVPTDPTELDQRKYQDLVDGIRGHLQRHRLGDTLVKIFDMLVEGWNKADIAEALGFKSASRLSYYIKELQDSVRSYIITEGDEGMAEAMIRALWRGYQKS